MRLSLDVDRDEARALATIAAALDGGVSWLDTARAYGRDETELGHNERLEARALAGRADGGGHVRVVTKCGMSRSGGRWEPDGRASAILEQARASLVALGRPPDILLLHVPDRSVRLATSVRALVRAREEGLARSVGLSNVSRGQLDALDRGAELAAVEVALGAQDDAAARGGVVAWCKEHGAALLAYAPLGGPSRVGRLARDPALRAIAERCSDGDGVTPAMVVLAYLLAIDPAIVPLVGCRRPETARAAARASRIVLDQRDLEALDARFPGLAMARRPVRAAKSSTNGAEVVLVMGVAGSGKTRLAESYVERGYERLNRDTLGGSLSGIAKRLGERLAAGAKRLVLDNTYVTRASRSEVVRVAHGAGAYVRCVHVDAPLSEAQVNVTWRMLERHGELLGGAELARRSKADPGLFAPSALFRMDRQLERPSEDEGFASIDVAPFVRAHKGGVGAVAMPIELMLEDAAPQGDFVLRPHARDWLERTPSSVPILWFGWREGEDDRWRTRAREAVLREVRDRPIEIGICAHAAGPPVCWCRPPLPGLWLAFARRHAVDPRVSVLVALTAPQRAMARTLGLRAVAELPYGGARLK